MTETVPTESGDYVSIVIGSFVLVLGMCLLGSMFFICGCMFQAQWGTSAADTEGQKVVSGTVDGEAFRNHEGRTLTELVSNTARQVQAMQIEQQRLMHNHLQHAPVGTAPTGMQYLHLPSMQTNNRECGNNAPAYPGCDHRPYSQRELFDDNIGYIQSRKSENYPIARCYHDHEFKL